ncbi:TetR family transcriptional regulator, partial [Methylobacterium goesingense]
MPRVSQEQAKRNRQRVVAVAATLFRERGLHGVGVADIMGAAGLTHGGFYGQFASKEALAAEAFDSALAEERRGALDALIANYLSVEHVRTPGQGCPLAALANDVAREARGSPLRARFTQGVRGLADLLADLTKGAR